MKRFFKFALVALATAAVAVACQKPEQQPEKIALKGISLNKPAVELAIGAKETLTVKFDPENVTEKPTIEWSTSAPAVATVAEGEVTAVAAGEATITAKAGSFTATCKVTVKGEEQPEPGDFTSPDWANIGAITNGNHTFKFTKDDKYAYFFSERTSEGRFNDIWGGEGYIYFAFDFDNNLETGETLNNNGKYEYIGYIFCFGEKPKVEIVADGDCLPDTYTVENIIAKGSADDNGVKVEYRVPLADLPQLPEKFTIYTWGNKDMAKVVYPVPFEASDDFDYTPSAEYLAEDNLWKAVDANHTIESFYNPNWSGEKTAPELAFKESTYKVTLPDACPADWNAQYWIRPAEQLVLDPAKKYSLKFTVNASTEGAFYVKLYQKGVDGAWSVETNPRVSLTANESYEIKLDDFSPITTPQDLLIDFSHHEANTTFYIKDIILKVTGEVPLPVEWDYTPSEEYLASSNLWKAKAAGHEMYYYYNASGADWNGTDTVDSTVPFLTINQSTYELDYAAATNELWQKQFFVFPAEGNEIPFVADKTYKIKVTLGTDAVKTPGFFKIAKYNDSNLKKEGETIWEKGNVSLAGSEPLVIESPEITGVDCSNINLMFAFGGNSADTKVYIKDIIVEEVGGDVPPAGLNVDVLDMEFTAVDKTSNSYFDWSDRAGAASTAIYAGQSSTGTGQYIQLRTKNNNSGIITTASGGKLRQVTVAFNSATTDRKINVYAKNTAYTSPTDLYDDTKAGTLLGSIQAGSGNYTIDVTDDYAFVGLRSADGAIYVDKIEIAWEPGGDVPPAPAGIKIDGDFSDWADVPGFESSGNTTKEWKFASDDENIYLYFKIVRSDVIASKTDDPADSGIFPYNWRRYCTFIIDTDNNPATGTDKTYKDLHLTGAEAWGLFYPFRGNANTASGTDGNPSVVNGVDEQGGVETPSTDKVKVYGVVEEDFAYLEAEISRASIGSPASGKMTIQVGLSYNNPDPQEVTLK